MAKKNRNVAIVSFKKRDGRWSIGKRFFDWDLKMLKGVLEYHINDLKDNGKKEFKGRIIVNGCNKYALTIDGAEWLEWS